MKLVIVGAGISGLATAHALIGMRPDLELVILEAGRRTGGKVWTDRTPQGYACEWGVNGFLNNKPRTLELSAKLGLEAVTGFKAANKRYVFRNRALHQLPESPPAFLTSGLMSLGGRLRVMLEPFIGRGQLEDETLAGFGTRRLGREAFLALIDPMASGVFAGDPEKMSLKSCFPRINEIETEFGSLIRGMIRLQIKARREGKGKGPGPGPGGHLTSFAHGMSEMTDRLTSELGSRIRRSSKVTGIDRDGKRYRVVLDSGAIEEAEGVILASPAYVQSEILRDLSPNLAGVLRGIEYPPLSVVCHGFRKNRVDQLLDGFGFLVPGGEGRAILGTIVDSNVFPNRAPEGSVLLRTMVGGSRAPQNALLDDEKLSNTVLSEMKDIMGIDADPEFLKIYRHERAIPQYHVGHARKLLAIGAELQKHPGLVLTGNAFRGVSLNDCIENAWLTAEKITNGQKLV